MRLTTRIRYALARSLLKAASLPIVQPGGWVAAHFFDPTFRSLVEEGYRKNAAFFATVETYAFAFPEPPLMVWTNDTDDATALPKHPLRLLLKKPNDLMGEDLLMMYTIIYCAIGGNAYWHMVKDGAGRVVQLWPYHAGQIRAVAGGPTWIDHYEFDYTAARPTQLDPADVVHFRWPSIDPLKPWESQPPLVAAAREVDTDNEATRYVFALLKNDAAPRGVLKLPPESVLTPDEYKRMKQQWHDRYGGDNRGDIAILEGGAEYVRLSMNMQELAFDALQRMPESRICAVMRVPPILAGLQVGLDNATYSNYEQARLAWTQTTLAPLWNNFASTAGAKLGPAFGNSISLRHDTSKVQALQENTDSLWTRVIAGFGAGIITQRNEARRLLGLPEEKEDENAAVKGTPILGYHIDAGVVSRNEARAQLGLAPEDETMDDKLRKLQSLLSVAQAAVNVGFDVGPALQLVGLEPSLAGPPKPPPAPLQLPGPAPVLPDAGAASSPAPPSEQPPKALPPRQAKQSAAATARLARSLQKVRRDTAKRMEKAVDAFFADLAETVAGRAGKAAKKLPGLDQLIQADDWIDLERTTKKYYAEVISASWNAWNGALGVDIPFELSDPAVRAAMKQAGTRIRDIGETTRDEVRSLLDQAAAEGWTIGQLAPELRSLVEETYKGRAQSIARTELGEAQQTAAIGRYDASGIKSVVVFDGGGEDSDDECNQLNGSVQTLEWARANTLGHPRCVRCFGPSYED